MTRFFCQKNEWMLLLLLIEEKSRQKWILTMGDRHQSAPGFMSGDIMSHGKVGWLKIFLLLMGAYAIITLT